MKTFFVNLITLYQSATRFIKRPSCVFYPSCSEYAKQAVEKYGVMKGALLSIKRILRCHPWQKNHIDPLK